RIRRRAIRGKPPSNSPSLAVVPPALSDRADFGRLKTLITFGDNDAPRPVRSSHDTSNSTTSRPSLSVACHGICRLYRFASRRVSPAPATRCHRHGQLEQGPPL